MLGNGVAWEEEGTASILQTSIDQDTCSISRYLHVGK